MKRKRSRQRDQSRSPRKSNKKGESNSLRLPSLRRSQQLQLREIKLKRVIRRNQCVLKVNSRRLEERRKSPSKMLQRKLNLKHSLRQVFPLLNNSHQVNQALRLHSNSHQLRQVLGLLNSPPRLQSSSLQQKQIQNWNLNLIPSLRRKNDLCFFNFNRS